MLEERLRERGEATPSELRTIRERIAGEIEQAVARAKAAPDAGAPDLGLDEVYT